MFYRNINVMECILQLLKILFQQCVYSTCNYTLSLFTTQAGPIGNVVYPLSPQQKVSMMRNLEKMIHQALNNTDEVCHCLLYSKFISQHFYKGIGYQHKEKIEFVDLFKLGSHSVKILKNDFLICFIGLLQKYLSRDLNFIRLVPVHEPSSDKSTVYFSFCWYPMPL